MKTITINDLELRLEVTLAKSRCSLSIEDVELLEATIQALRELKILADPFEKKKKVEEIANNLFRFYANLDILQKYQKELNGIMKQLV